MRKSSDSGFSMAGLLAILAGVVGVALLVIAAVRIVAAVRDAVDSPPATTSAAVTTSTVASSTSVAASTSTVGAGDFVFVSDETGALSISIPNSWTDVSGSGWLVDGEKVGPAVTAASDVDAWYSSWGTSGVFVGVSTTGHTSEHGDFSEVCTAGKSAERSLGALSGTVDAWSACGDETSDFYVFIGAPADGSYSVTIQLVSVGGGGLAVLDHILTTFSYAP